MPRWVQVVPTLADPRAAKTAFDRFLTGKNPTGNAIEFIDLIVNHLADRGPARQPRLQTFCRLSPRIRPAHDLAVR
jgi:hypothetical protein